ncbi:MAG: glycoside hydrolase, partial [Acidobacteria bacterium]
MRRQTILRAAAAVLTLIACSSGLSQAQHLVKIDYRKVISRGDLDYSEPARRSEEGMPVGNGRMGSLVWTTPSSLKFQINRVDVFAADGRTASFPVVDSDYASGCAYVDINVTSAGEDVFSPGPNFNQHLSIYDGLMTAGGKGVTARVLGWPARDV